jgi:SAM-dependent methyltransferase
VHCQDELLPFAPDSFDLILNRHSALDPADIARILTPGGSVLTQQVGNDNWDDIRPYFPQKTDWGDHYTRYREGFRANGLTIFDDRWHKTPAAFDSLGDFVYCLCVANWEAPGLDPLGNDLETLLQMERDLTTAEGFVVTETRYILEARKPT